MSSPRARQIHLLLGTFVGAALLLRLGLTIVAPDPVPGEDPGLGTRLVRYVSYFTVESNFAVLLASLAVVRGAELGTTWMRTLRLASLVGITVTGIVYVLVLSDDPVDRSTASWIANVMLHYLAPPLTLMAWLTVGPWPGFRWADAGRILLWPVIWGSWIVLFGELSGWYPYGFVDVDAHGYAAVAVNFGGIVGFAVVLGALFTLGDRWRRRNADAARAS